MTVIMRISHGTRGDRHGDGPMIRRDHLDDLRSMADGKVYTSKSEYYRSLKEKGLEIDDRPRMREVNRPEHDLSDLKGDIAHAISNPLSPEKAAEIEHANRTDINGED